MPFPVNTYHERIPEAVISTTDPISDMSRHNPHGFHHVLMTEPYYAGNRLSGIARFTAISYSYPLTRVYAGVYAGVSASAGLRPGTHASGRTVSAHIS